MIILESVVRLYFDLLHGIKRMNVPLVMVLEFAILLGFDGQLDQNSDMEKEFFTSAIDQLKGSVIIISLKHGLRLGTMLRKWLGQLL